MDADDLSKPVDPPMVPFPGFPSPWRLTQAKNRAQSAQKSIEALKWQTSHKEFRGMQLSHMMMYVENPPLFIDIGSSSLVSDQNSRINMS